MPIFSATVLGVLLSTAGINWFMNPDGRFGSHGMEERNLRMLVSLLLQGHGVANVGNIDHRKLHEYYVDGLRRPPDIIVFGSSRALPFGAPFFPGHTFFNHAMPRATLYDFLILWQWYEVKGSRPKKVIFVLDSWVVCDKVEPYGRFENQTDYERMARRLGIDPFVPGASEGRWKSRVKDLVSLPLLKRNTVSLLNQANYVATDQMEAETSIKRADGSFSYPKTIRERTPEEVRVLATERLGPPYMLDLERDHWPNQTRVEALERFVIYLKDQGVDSVFCLVPYHPTAYATIRSSSPYAGVLAAENVYRRLADQLSVPFVGSYDPNRVGCRAEEFDDGVHPRNACLDKIPFPVFSSSADRTAIPPFSWQENINGNKEWNFVYATGYSRRRVKRYKNVTVR